MLALPLLGLSYILIATASTTWPGTTSSVAGLVVGVTNPSPSTIMSSAANPVALNKLVAKKLPPLNDVS